MLNKNLVVYQNGESNKDCILIGEGFQLSIITDRLFRIQTGQNFTELPTQCVWFRDLGKVNFTTIKENNFLKIKTKFVELKFDTTKKTAVSVTFADTKKESKISDKGNLLGTRRTLDATFGRVKLKKGLMSKNGIATIDDSKTLLIENDGSLHTRKPTKDIYIFAYGRDYQESLTDFYKLTGATPLIPRFALGVWWSRYRAYSQKEYMELITKFEDENIPLTVATVDMDWHWTNLNKKFSEKYKNKIGVDNPVTGGWTGYSWNTELFPDYKMFLKDLKHKNLKITLNLHPKDGIRWFEDKYKDMATAMGINPDSKKAVEFDVTDDKFVNNYFDIMHNPYEKDGVDFWWIDWQQGKKTKKEGLDPLWALNHYHFLDNAKSGKIPLILSRYAGVGSHRYPLGFSGDTAINWRVLNFQPYFTSNAANIGYTWWSHDIGGHHLGVRDDELYVRWIQFGVFSPIMRLHSSSHDLLGKEPWLYSGEIKTLAKKYLRLRHSLIPYLYTMNFLTHTAGIPLCMPTYYKFPDDDGAYLIKNQYFFGSELLVCPICKKANSKTRLANSKMYIPKGRWTDIFTKKIYENSGLIDVYRDISTIPVLLKEGGILPLSNDKGNFSGNPENIKLMISRGNGSFTLYEDNGTTNYEKNNFRTLFTVSEDNNVLSITISPEIISESQPYLPLKRCYEIEVIDVIKVKKCTYSVADFIDKGIPNDAVVDVEMQYDSNSDKTAKVIIPAIAMGQMVKVIFKDYKVLTNKSEKNEVVEIFSRWQASVTKKRTLYMKIKREENVAILQKKLKSWFLPKALKGAISEIFKRKK